MGSQRRTWTNKAGDKSKVWMVDFIWKAPSGEKKRIRERSPVNTRAGAEEFERQLRKQLLEGTFVKTKVPTLSEFAERLLTYAQNNNKPSELSAKTGILKNHLDPAFGKLPLDEIGLEQIEDYKASKVKDLSPKSVNNHLAVLSKLLTLAVEYSVLKASPRVKMLKVTKSDFDFLHLDEVDRFREAAPAEWRAMLIVAYRTGLRIGELLALKWEDVDLVAERILVKRNLWNGIEGLPKGGRTREVPLMSEAVAVLKAHRAVTRLQGQYVFCTATGGRLTHSMVKDVVPRVCSKAGLAKRLTWHDLRHTFASHLVMRGTPLVVVKEYLGHADLATTMIYAHLEPKERNAWVKLLEGPALSAAEKVEESK